MPLENMLLKSLPATERERFSGFLDEVEIRQEQVLIEADQPIEYIYFPFDAVTSTMQLLSDGTAVEAGLMGLEGMIGIQLWLRQRTTPSRTLVQIPGRAARMNGDVFLREVVYRSDSPMNDLLAGYVHGFLSLTSQTAACNRMHSIDQRLCRWLRMVYNRTPSRDELPLKQEFLAAMLGVQRPTVSTAASILQRAGLIQYSRGRMKILNPDGLLQGSCECYEMMESQFDRIFRKSWRPK